MTSKRRARTAARIALLAMLVHAATAQGKAVNDSQQRLWDPGSTLRICVVPPATAAGQAAAAPWTALIPGIVADWGRADANLHLKVELCGSGCSEGDCSDPCKQPQQVRIAYSGDTASRTLRGTEALDSRTTDKGCPTLRFSIDQLKKAGDDWGRGLLLHEIGHALGLVHEHQRAGDCTVNPRAQRALAGLPAEPTTTLSADVDRNFVPVEPRLLPGVGFQPDSVMTYAFPASLNAELSSDPTLNAALTACLAERPVKSLSEHDRAVLRAAYPATPNPATPNRRAARPAK